MSPPNGDLIGLRVKETPTNIYHNDYLRYAGCRLGFLVYSRESAIHALFLIGKGFIREDEPLVIRGPYVPRADNPKVDFFDDDWAEHIDAIYVLGADPTLGHGIDDVHFDLARRGIDVALIDKGAIPTGPQKGGRYVFRHRGLDYILEKESVIPSHYANREFIDDMVELIDARGYRRLLDMFSGQGSIGLSCYTESESLTFVGLAEINPLQAGCIKSTVKRNRIPRDDVGVFHSDLFSGVPKSRYDLIVGNPPHQDRETESLFDIQGGDKDWQAHRRFFAEAGEYLTSNGEVHFIECGRPDMASPELFQNMAEESSSSLEFFGSHDIPGTEWFVISLRGKSS